MRIDAHIHFGDRHPEALALLEELDVKLLNICVAHDSFGNWRRQAEQYQALAAEYPERYAWCTSFDLPRFDDPGYVDSVLAGLANDFAAGAVACKAWKNLGMEVKTPAGEFFMVDDPLLDPVFDYVAKAGRTLLMHIAEPYSVWQPLTPDSPHYGYYSRNPQWHMYGKPEYPSHEQLMAARDRVAEKHPDLRVVGAHVGSLEYDMDEVAARFKRYPNFAVDVSARLSDLARLDSDRVRRLFLEFPDRILFGTDVVMRKDLSAMSEEERAKILDSLRNTYRVYRAYFESKGMVDVNGRQVQGLGLPDHVLEQFYVTNAQQWYPGI
ncbi:MAG TPA: amidohydrolase family protein [Caldilineaceae bacterium]|nr:amidohydrolase family protein [Caldilineaceae bacterium]